MRLNGYLGYAICEKCKREFFLKKPVYDFVDAHSKGTVIDDFLNLKFNLVKCEYCKAKFNYEIPVFVCDMYNNYAVFTGERGNLKPMPKRLFEIIRKPDFKIYRVPFIVHAVEIVNCYRYCLDPDEVTKIKNRHLKADELDITEENIIFWEKQGESLCFKHINFLNEELNTYNISIKE